MTATGIATGVLVEPDQAVITEVDISAWSFEGRFADWTADARYFEYTKAANPIGAGLTPRIPIRQFSSELHRDGPSRVVPLDLSRDLGVADGPTTSPGRGSGRGRPARPDPGAWGQA
jgi:hypothetical protein